MYTIGISGLTYDASGSAVMTPVDGTDIRVGEKRISRTKTLDGGVIVTNNGHCAGDMTFELVFSSEAALWDTLWHIYETHAWITVATQDGCYRAALYSIRDEDGKISVRAYIESKLSE